MFARIASYYDGANRVLSFGLDAYWRARAAALMNPRPDGLYLDVGVGTGDSAFALLTRAECAVTGVDASVPMMRIARAKAHMKGLENRMAVARADALELPFADHVYDGVITAFCIRNVTDRARALREMRRVLRPGAELVVLELTQPMGPIMKPFFRAYAKLIMPVLTKALSSVSAYRYLAESMADFPPPGQFTELMERAGFSRIRVIHLTGGIVTLFVGVA
jgi:demethylmenaquinone methyltransferase/2-methoxy-6-polyprenyl-1,4-benzoquinol methylase